MTVEVRERGSSAPLTPSIWESISADPGFRDLVARSVLSAEPDRVGKAWRLRAGAYVGRATLGGVEVHIREKVPGAFEAMASVLAPRAFRFAHAASPIIHGAPPDRILAAMLVAATRTYLSGFAATEYTEERGAGAYVAGALDVRRTTALRARGVRHKVAFARSVLTDDLPINRAIYSALGEIASHGGERAVGHELASSARALRSWFHQSARTSQLMSRVEIAGEAVATADTRGQPPQVQEAAILAAAVLQGASLARNGRSDAHIPRSWFVNLENLFERFLQTLTAQCLQDIAQVGDARSWPGGTRRSYPQFAAHPGRYLANPDVVILDGQSVVLADAKYKDFDGQPAASDIHQLLAHSAACGAGRAALFYPADGNSRTTTLGTSSNGCQVWAFALDLQNAEKCLREALGAMGLLPALQAA